MKLLHYILFFVAATLMIAAPMRAETSEASKPFTVVIDPGHGGKDAGALGVQSTEKSINLAVAKELENIFNRSMPDAKVFLTRSTDVFLTLQQRPDFANNKRADIFISIHANSVDLNSPGRTSVQGASVYTLGLKGLETNLGVAMRENAVMKLESDYSTVYQGFNPSLTESYIAFEMLQQTHMQQSISLAEAVQENLVKVAGRKNGGVKQAPFWVLVRTGMPAILVELDFICNPVCEQFMTSRTGVEKLAHAIFNGVEKYRFGKSRTRLKQTASTESEQQTVAEVKPDKQESKTEVKTEENTDRANSSGGDDIIYKVQFMISPRELKANDPKLRGLQDTEFYVEGNSYKYTSGRYATQREAANALREVRKLFPDAFVIKTAGGKRVK